MRQLTLIAPLLGLVACGPSEVDSPLVVNEFVADNVNGLAGPDQDFPDWVELHNTGADDESLAGYALSDDPDELALHLFDDTLFVPAGGYVVLYADGGDDVDRLPFGLSADGETLVLSKLVDGQMALVDGLTFGALSPDVAGARLPDGAGDWTFDDSPTPGARND